MSGGWSVVLAVGLLGAAASTVTALLVRDAIFQPFRARWFKRFRPPGWADAGLPEELDGAVGWDPANPEGFTGWRSMLGYWMTCTSCVGVWVCAGWWVAWRAAPSGALTVAVPFAVMAVQRFLNDRAG